MRNYRREKEYRFVFEFVGGALMPVKEQAHIDLRYSDFIHLADVMAV